LGIPSLRRTAASFASIEARNSWSRRRDQLDYHIALERELPIGSGLIESGHKHVLQARLKLPGCAWLKGTAANMAQLRVLRANQNWESIWN
jgi:hypothetical protein